MVNIIKNGKAVDLKAISGKVGVSNGDKIVITDSINGQSSQKLITKKVGNDLVILEEGSAEPLVTLESYYEGPGVELSGMDASGESFPYVTNESYNGFELLSGPLEAPAAGETVAATSAVGGGTTTGLSTMSMVGLGGLGVAGATAVAVGSQGGEESSHSTPVIPDTTSPTATITLSNTALKIGDTSTVTIRFSEAVSNFSNADLSIANGTLSTLATTDNITWTATFTPDSNIEDTTNIITLANTYTDSAGNIGTSASSSNYTIDTLAPIITSSTISTNINENSGAGQLIYTVTATDGNSITYSLSGVDALLLNINSSTGEVTLNANPDYETKNNYNFTVIATDGAGNTSEQVVSLAINNLDEIAPTITSSTIATAIDENSGASQIIYTATSTDTADISAGVTYSLSGTDASLLNINATSGEVRLNNSANYESQTSYSFTVVANDGITTPTTKDVVLSITNLDEIAPTITSATTAPTLNEKSGVGQLIYIATSTDTADIASGATIYSLKSTGDFNLLNIDSVSGAVTLIDNPNYETKSSYSFTVVATDSANNASERAINLAINNLDEIAPTITSGTSATARAENSGAGQIIYTVTSTDTADIANGATTYTLKNTGDYTALSINSTTGAVTLIGNPDYETKSNYSFTVVATDLAGNASESSVSLVISNLDEVAPTFTSGAIATASENISTSTVVYDANVDDTADISNGISYSFLTMGGSDYNVFNLNASTGTVTFKTSPDYENPSDSGHDNIYNFTVRATDLAGNHSDQNVALSITDIFLGETIMDLGSYGNLIKPIQLDGKWYYIWDMNGDGVHNNAQNTNGMYGSNGSVVNALGNGFQRDNMSDDYFNAVFNHDINGVTSGSGMTNDYRYATINGMLLALPTSGTGASVESAQYYLPDGGNYTDLAKIWDTYNTGFQYSKGSPTGWDNYYYYLSATPSTYNHTELYLNAGSIELNNYGSAGYIALQVISKVAPTFTSDSSVTVEEYVPTSTVVYDATADNDTGITYSLKPTGDYTYISLNSATGAVTFISSPVYTTKNSYNFTVIATDSANNATESTVTLNIHQLDVFAPLFTSGITATLAENAAVTTVVYTATTTDVNSVTYSFNTAGGSDYTLFTLDSMSGIVKFNTSPNYEAPSDTGGNNIYNFTIRATDTLGNYSDQTVALSINNIIEGVSLSAIASGSGGGFVINGKNTYDGSGGSVSNAGDINGDGLDDLIVGVSGASTYTGKSYVVFAQTTGTPINLSSVEAGVGGFVINGESAYNYSGSSVSNAGDVNGDGVNDLIVGAYNANSAAGKSYVVFGKSTTSAINLSDIVGGNGGFVINGESSSDKSGYSVSNAGDVNGDGLDDLIVGSQYAYYGCGKSYVVFGKTNTSSINLTDISAGIGGFVINGHNSNDYAGISVSNAGDVNGDGLDDLIVGANGANTAGGVDSGISYVVFGKTGTSMINLSDVSAGIGGFMINGQNAYDNSGSTVSNAGDINGDGLDDLIVAADRASSNAGKSYVVFGKTTGAAINLSSIESGVGGFVINGQSVGDYSGGSVSSAGDINGDGLDDLIVGAKSASSGAGKSYVVFGKTTGTAINLSSIELGVGGFVITGQSANDYFGVSVSGAGDVNGDGFDDLIVGAYGADPAGVSSAGKSYVIFGGSADYTQGAIDFLGDTADNTLTGTSANEQFVAGAGNDTLIGNGGKDVMYGGMGDDTFIINTSNVTALSDNSNTSSNIMLINGGTGTDTINLDGSGVFLDFTTISGTKVTDIEVINITGNGNNSLKLTYTDLLHISNTNALTIKGDSGDSVSIIGATSTGTETVLGIQYNTYNFGGSSATDVWVQTNVAVITA